MNPDNPMFRTEGDLKRSKMNQAEIRRLKKDLTTLIAQVYKWAGRPTRDGAKKLRNVANECELKWDLHALVDAHIKERLTKL